ncbi:ABC transporter substrate-binding protein [Cohnella cellulosilytica]|uniref:ABC transporter substrate-binding protein n=1 Tax=Cohnella cellulosilytica TaxID=986710 RepID=A0ABW2FC20_9BACL
MKKQVKWLGLACMTAVLGASLSACGGESNNHTADQTTGQPSAAAQPSDSGPAKPITLRFSWWGSDPRHQATLAAIEAYRKKYPNVTIEGEYQGYDGYQQKLMTQIAGGAAPDVVQFDNVWNQDLGNQGDVFVDFNQEADVDLTTFPEKVLQEYGTVNGKLIGLPMGTNGFGLDINKQFFETHGLSADTEWTWDSFIEAGRKIHEADKEAYLFSTDLAAMPIVVFDPYLRSKTGAYWLNDDYQVTASKEELADGFSLIKELYESGTLQPLGEAALFTSKLEQMPKFVNGQIGSSLEWSGTVGKYKAVLNENFAVAKPIKVKDGIDPSISFKPSMLLGVSSNSANKAEAVKFANWLLNDPEAALILTDQRSVPTSEAARQALVEADKIDPDIAKVVDFTSQDPAAAPPVLLSNAEVFEIEKDVLQKVAFASLTPEQAADELTERVQAKLDELKEKAK